MLVEQPVVHDWNSCRDREAWESECCTLLHDLVHAEKDRFPKTNKINALANWSKLSVPCTDPGHYLKTSVLIEIINPKELNPDAVITKYLARLEGISASQRFVNGLVVSAGPVAITDPGLFWQAVVLANDAVNTCALGSIVICDGHFQAQANFTESLVIARGGVTIPADMYRSLIVSGGPVRFTNAFPCIHDSVIVTSDKVELPKKALADNTTIKEQQADPFGFIRFFEPTAAGIETEMNAGAVRIKTVDPNKAFAKARVSKPASCGVDD